MIIRDIILKEYILKVVKKVVTVLLAAYNGEKFIAEQLDSLVNQTYKDLKIVIRDDGSIDATNEIINRYAEIHPDKIEICPFSNPTGSAAGNFFKLLELYKDDYIMLCDQDDVWQPDKVEKTLFFMKEQEEKHGTDTPILVHTDLYVANEKLDILSQSFIKYQNLSTENTALNQILMQNCITGCTVMINRAFHEKLYVFPSKLGMHDWWLGIIAAAFGKIAFLNAPTILYRQHGSNEVGAKNAKSLSFIFEKIKKVKLIKENYKLISLQAEFLRNNYQELLTAKQKRLLDAVADLPNKNRIEKIKTIKKYRLYKNTVLRNIAQLIII